MLKDGPNLLYNLLFRLASSGGPVFLTITLTKSLPIEETGKFFSALVVLNGLSILLQAGQPLLLIRELKGGNLPKPTTTKIFCTTFSNIMILSILATATLFCLSKTFLEPTDPFAWVWTLLIPTTTITQISSFYRGIGKSNKGALLEAGIISTLTSFYICIFPQYDAFSAWYIMTAIAWFIMLVTFTYLIYSIEIRLNHLKGAAENFREAYKFWILTTLNYLSQWGGVILIIFLKEDSEIAIINAVLRLFTPLQFIVSSIDLYLAPKIFRVSSQNLLQLRNFGRICGLILATPYAVLLIVRPHLLLDYFYGNLGNIPIESINILMATGIIQIAIGPHGILLNMLDREGVVLRAAIVRIFAKFFLILVLNHTNQNLDFYLAFSLSTLVQSTYQWHYAKASRVPIGDQKMIHFLCRAGCIFKVLIKIRRLIEVKSAINQGMTVGKGTRFVGRQQFGTEPYLITIGSNCLIANGVTFINHDGAIQVPLIKRGFNFVDIYAKQSRFGRIRIGNNVFIGTGATVLLDTCIADNSIIGAGAIVRGNFPDNSVICGNPAKVVQSLSSYEEKNAGKIFQLANQTRKSSRKTQIMINTLQK